MKLQAALFKSVPGLLIKHLRKMPTTSVSITIYDSQQKFGIFLIQRQSG